MRVKQAFSKSINTRKLYKNQVTTAFGGHKSI
jgi:hypothetical protein